MLSDRHGQPIGGEPPNPGIRTPSELRAAIERGELGGEIVREGPAAAEELEVRKRVQIQAMEGVETMLSNWASQLELKGKAEENIPAMHQMFQTALCFRNTTSHIKRQREMLQGPPPETNGNGS